VREGWVADLVLINDEPLENISILQDHETAIALVMKKGVAVKNRLQSNFDNGSRRCQFKRAMQHVLKRNSSM
jgi:hypothetical protein